MFYKKKRNRKEYNYNEKNRKNRKMSELEMKFIMNEGKIMDKSSRITIAKMLYQNDPSCLQDKQDGTRVVLNNVSPETITLIYNFIKNKLKSL